MARFRAVTSKDENGVVTSATVPFTTEEEDARDAEEASPRPYIKLTWSGGGTLNGDIYDLTPDGALQAILTLERWDLVSDAAINSGGDVYWVCVEGVAAKPDVGKVTLDGNGQAVVTFTPAADELGMASVRVVPSVGSSPKPSEVAKLGLG